MCCLVLSGALHGHPGLQAVQSTHVLQKRLEKPLFTLYSGDLRPENGGPPFDENQDLKRIFAERARKNSPAPVSLFPVFTATTSPPVISELIIVDVSGDVIQDDVVLHL